MVDLESNNLKKHLIREITEITEKKQTLDREKHIVKQVNFLQTRAYITRYYLSGIAQTTAVTV